MVLVLVVVMTVSALCVPLAVGGTEATRTHPRKHISMYTHTDTHAHTLLYFLSVLRCFSLPKNTLTHYNIQFPGVHHIKLLEGFLKEGVQFDRNIIPSKSANDFVRGAVMLADLNTWCMATVGPHNFGLKWQNGRARPEEVANMIRLGQIDPSYYPPAISAALSQLTFSDPTEFTAYDEGCPPHPAWPAMHSAASAGSLWMALVLNLTPEQACEARAVDYAISYARTVAGVHYRTDNIAGLTAGQEILARKLPRYMAWRYGSDPYAVKEKIKSIRFDWNEYLTSDCFA